MDTYLIQFQNAQMKAILRPSSRVPFETFISDHMSSSDKINSEAESIFNMMKQKDPESLALKLVDYLSHPSHNLDTRQECAKLLHKLITDDDDLCTWHNLSVSAQSTIKSMILDCMKVEDSNYIIKKLRKTVSKLAASFLPDNTWPELLPSLYQWVIGSGSNCVSVFLIFAKLADDKTIVPCIKQLLSLFLSTLSDTTLDLDMKMAAVRGVFRIIRTLTEKEQFQDQLPGIMRMLTEALTIHIEAAKHALECAELLLIDDEYLENRSSQLLVEFFTQFQKERTIGEILGPDLEPFQTFIFNYMSVKDPETQSMFYMMKQMHPDSLVIKLASYLGRPCHRLRTRHVCALLLKKLLTDKDDFCTWQKLSVSTRSTIKCMILARIEQEESNFIIHKLIDTVSLLLDNTWPEILPCLYQHVINSSSSNHLRAEAFLIFGELAEHIGETTVPCIKDLHRLFLNTLNDDTLCLDVRISATRAVITFIQCVSSSNGKERFQDLLPGVMRILTDTLSNSKDQEDAADYMLDLFIKLAQNEPKFFRRQLVIVAGSMMEIAEDEKLKEGTRQRAVEFLITLVEERERTPGMMRKLPSFISRCFTMLLNLLLDIEDDPAWHSAETGSDNTGATSNFKVGAECLGRFSVALGGKSIAHTAKEQLSAYLVAPEWEKRHAALVTLAHIAKGCSKLVMFKNLEQPVNMALICLQDPHPRVRLAACRAIHHLSTVYCPDYQKQYHNQVVPALAATLDDLHPRVQESASEALWTFFACYKEETLIPYLDGLVNKLLVLVQSGKLMVQKTALMALSRLSLSVKGHFRTYYDTVMPHLKAILRNTDLKSNHRLHGIALQCISFVGSAGGKDKFREDAAQVMEGLISLQGLHSKGDDPISSNLLRTCGNICICLGRDFLPYMNEVMPFFIIRCAQLEPVSTCLIICCYADKLEEDFYPWVPQVVSIVFPLLKFHTHNVRKTAVEAMYNLLYSAKLAVEKGIAQGGIGSYFIKLSDDIILSLLEALHEEPMIEVCPFILDRLNGCLQICGPLVNEGQLHRIVDEVKHVITESSNRKGKLKERAKSEDFDAEEDELLRGEKEQEDNIFVQLRRILKTLIKTFKAAFLPFFDELSSYLIPMWGKENTAQERCTAIDIFARLVRECPEVTLKYCDVFLPLFVDASNDEHPTVRQCALYGLALYAEYGGTVFKPYVTEAISRINVVIMHFRAREPENENVYYSAVYALGTICQFHRESIGSAQEKMRSGELLNVEPLDLEYPQLISRSFHLSNKTENHVAFRVKTMNAKKYCVRPNKGIVLPGSTCDLIVTMQAQKEAPSDMQCKDRFLLQSIVANPGTTPGDFTQEMFKKEVGRVVDECRLRVIYIPPPQPPFPVAESSRQFMKDIGHLDGSKIVPIWLYCLPIKGDLDEAKYVHDLLCSMVERLDRELIGPYYQGLPKIISVFAEVLCSEKALATEKTAHRMINVLRHLQQALPPAMWESAWSYLLPRQVMELKSILSP
ncbi:uncharacterized protein LOC107788039 isoform X2 [Nicotiana tabacum]|uniref:Importin-5 isoform X2 n=2 Tax=Nicotiana TaxID=4085 RepID=A0A1S3ZLD6_TOBAC|nr:PREDICTED: importin-5-like isoform X2 [Nicotiana sylvestris]XP_016465167.1 PREDICTED: importin-5-like isoform X2 [Nicotiana tabacum]